MFRLLLIFVFLSCSSTDESNQFDVVYNYIYSATIPQIIESEKVDRKFWVRAPKKITKNKYPLVFFFHGNGGEAYGFLQNTPQITNLVDSDQFIAIFPDGHLKSWNCGNENSKADDVMFIKKIVDHLKTNVLPVDLMDFDKIYGIGISNGSLILNKIAKETSIFTGIAPIISQQSDSISITIAKKPISLFQINGTNDDVIPVNGGKSIIGHTFLSAKQSAENWALNSNCNLNGVVENSSNWGNYSVNSFTYTDCDDNRLVSYHLVNGARHQSNFGPNDQLYMRVWDFLKVN